ncbi:MAG: hypothetical protein CEE43_04300 [Promethearchaeota archaeon Loki_b32]|nr:MAG: hypothetical protein CEE43_04300 [Candidatus Lokiarchaeota archaeon Loki_b32]
MSDKNPDLERSLLDIADEVNPYFFEWLKSTISLEVIRSLEINTFLLNYFISLNYFPAHELIDKIYTGKEYTEEQLNDLKNFRDYTERMHGIYLLMTMKSPVLLIWRSMIKYFEELQQDEYFRNLKGKMLERWCFVWR